MKKLFVFMLCFLFLACNHKTEDEPEDDFNCDSWDYPVKPGTEEWKQFTTQKEQEAGCQIPEDILLCLSTERLTDLCLQYPLYVYVLIHNFLDTGLDWLFASFNGVQELYKREDMSSFLVKRYMEKIQSLPFLEEDHSILEKGNFMLSITYLHALLSRVERKHNENTDSLQDVLRALVAGYEEISQLPDISMQRSLLKYHFYTRAHIIIKMCETCLGEIPQGKANIVFSGNGVENETAGIINNLSYQLIK